MRSIAFALLLAFSSSAFADNSIIGVWHLQPSSSGNNFSPEALFQFEPNGAMTIIRQMPNRSQKLVTKNQVKIGANALTFVAEISATRCSDLQDDPVPAGALLPYSVSGDQLTVIGTVMTRATFGQIQRLSTLTEGCK
jgi:hypothetical protein